MKKKIKSFLFDKKVRFGYLNKLGLYRKLSDEEFLHKAFKIIFEYKLDLSNPQTFNEKLQWLKLYDRKTEYTYMVDKYEAKKYVATKIGEQYIIPTLGVWERFEDIDFETLPNQFVLKCTHDSGGLIICRDKRNFDIEAARKKIKHCLKTNYYQKWREWPYKDVKPRIIAEQYMEDSKMTEISGLTDYKFYCFNGTPQLLYVSQGLENHSTASISFLTLDWKFAPYKRNDYKSFSKLPPKPEGLEEMIEIARVLSKECNFVRVDLYQIEDRVYFSEITFSPGGGFTPFKDATHDLEIGQKLILSSKMK